MGILCDACQGFNINKDFKEDCIFVQQPEELPKLSGQSQVRNSFREFKGNDRVGLTS